MAIKVRHSGGSSSGFAAAFRGGKGKREAEDARQALDIAAKASEASKARGQQSLEAYRERQFRAEEGARQRAFQASEGAANRAAQAANAALSAAGRGGASPIGAPLASAPGGGGQVIDRDEEHKRQLEKMEWSQQLGEYTLEHRLSAEQQAEFNRLNKELEVAEASELYTPEELEDLKRQVHERQLGIVRSPKTNLETPGYSEGQGIGDVWQADDGSTLTRDRYGDVKLLNRGSSPRELDPKTFMGIYADVVNSYEGDIPKDVDIGKEVGKRIDMFRQMQDRFAGRGATAGTVGAAAEDNERARRLPEKFADAIPGFDVEAFLRGKDSSKQAFAENVGERIGEDANDVLAHMYALARGEVTEKLPAKEDEANTATGDTSTADTAVAVKPKEQAAKDLKQFGDNPAIQDYVQAKIEAETDDERRALDDGILDAMLPAFGGDIERLSNFLSLLANKHEEEQKKKAGK